jgi:hypothetical protein
MGVHIGAERRDASRLRPVQHADDGGLGDAAVRDPERVELALDERRRALLFEPEFGKPMDFAS